ncbi:glycosyltransferase family 2 protein [Chlorobaculum sp. MV4-Y]|uniref:glycosyltransferase family 2 protein n=1 Tax=Chlorobaculum sp. MV4-Y TaxID=2976335 RepID=UPI0021AFFE21|nr:glycosyltransferase family 2 protein [Chlorobaculum sp. MV4-Y]UWX57855.1 glycosyltransferase family 2 protein [Chlorobaculum sp. MV4-Y]
MDRFWLYMLCYNEELLLPFTLDYYSRFAERIFVWDNMSTDSSPDICKRYPNVTVKRFNTGGQLKDKVFQRIKNKAWKKARGKARYVGVIDTDEIIYHPQGLDSLLDQAYEANANIIRQTNAYRVYSANRTRPANDFSLLPENMDILCGPEEGKTAIFSPELREINYKPGAHRCKPKGKNLSEFVGGLWFHYSHVLGAEIMAKKYEDRMARMSRLNKRHNWGFHYALKYDELLECMSQGTVPLSDIL